MNKLLFAVVVNCIALAGCSTINNDGGIKGDIVHVREFASPDGNHIASVYGYNRHDTTGYPKYVDLRRAGTQLRHPGNITVVGPDDVVSASWLSSTQMVVSYYYGHSRPGPSTKNIDGVVITFQMDPKLQGAQQ
jgi:predicted small secreted protein